MTVSIVGTPVVKIAFAAALPAWTIPAAAIGTDVVLIYTGSTYFSNMVISPAMTQIGEVSSSSSGSSSVATVGLWQATVAALGGAGATVTVSNQDGTSANMAAGFICLHSDAGTLSVTPADSTAFDNSAGASAAGATAPALANAAGPGLVVFGSHVVSSTAITYTAPAGYTQQAQGARGFASVDLCTKAVAAGDAIGAATDTASASGQWVGAQVLAYEMTGITGSETATASSVSALTSQTSDTATASDLSTLTSQTTDTAALADITNDIAMADAVPEITVTDTSALGNVAISLADTITAADSSATASAPAGVDSFVASDRSSLTVQSVNPSSSDLATFAESSALAASFTVSSADRAFMNEVALLIQAGLAHEGVGQVSVNYSPSVVTIGVMQ